MEVVRTSGNFETIIWESGEIQLGDQRNLLPQLHTLQEKYKQSKLFTKEELLLLEYFIKHVDVFQNKRPSKSEMLRIKSLSERFDIKKSLPISYRLMKIHYNLDGLADASTELIGVLMKKYQLVDIQEEVSRLEFLSQAQYILTAYETMFEKRINTSSTFTIWQALYKTRIY